MPTEQDKDIKKIFQLIDHLEEAATDPGETHICPICGGPLHVWFTPYMRGEKPMVGIQVFCESCDVMIAIDKIRPSSGWLTDFNRGENST